MRTHFTLLFPIALAALVAACGSSPHPAARPPNNDLNPPTPPQSPKLMGPDSANVLLEDAWKKNSVTPAAVADDATYFRRVSLDITGVIPTAKDLEAFLADTSPGKREKAVDAMLASPGYADHMTNVWDRILLGREVKPGVVDRFAFRAWLHEQFAKNVPYDQTVRSLVTATGQNSVGGRPFDRTEAERETNEAKINGAVNWFLHFDNLPDLAGSTSRTFLGVQIQCAQCHDHKTEKWKQTDFRSFAAIFNHTKRELVDKAKTPGTRKLDVVDVDRNVRAGKNAPADSVLYQQAIPKTLDGTDLSKATNRRQALAEWMTSPKNPYFTREIVNRTWADFTGRGFFEPVDDFRESNPPVLPELMDTLAADFVRSHYDLKHLIHVIALTEAYQHADGTPGPAAGMDDKLWGHFQLQRLGPDELLDSVARATDLGAVLDKAAGENIDKLRFAMRHQFAFVFDVDETGDHHDEFDGTISQALLLMNGNLVNRGASALPLLAVGQVLKADSDDRARVRALTLRTLSRPPTDDELAKWVTFVQTPRDVAITPDTPASSTATTPPPAPTVGKKTAKDVKKGQKKKAAGDPLNRVEARLEARADKAHLDAKHQAYEDLMWAQLNSSEFNFNH
ncbi:MAG: DUF1549 and DUF1553 domain-containing protein [Polyangiaceae bacterium]